MAKRYTQQQIEDLVKKSYNGEYKLISQYTKMKDPALVIHLKCNKKIKVTNLKSFFQNKNHCCKECYPNKINKRGRHLTEEEFLKKFISVLKNEYSYLGGYKFMTYKITVKHNICGFIFQATPKMMIGSKKSRCPICSNKNRGKYALKENYLEEILKLSPNGKEYKWLEPYKNNNKIKIKIKHKICGFEYMVKPNDFQQGYRCPKCCNNSSKEVLFIENYFLNNKIDYEREKKFSNCKYKLYLPFDFYLKKINYLIEFDGEQHFKPSGWNDLKEQRLRDEIKNNFCFKHKINFIRLHYRLKIKDIKLILDELIKNKSLSKTTIMKYKILIKQNKTIFNKKSYYKN